MSKSLETPPNILIYLKGSLSNNKNASFSCDFYEKEALCIFLFLEKTGIILFFECL